uniref:Si:dkey-24f15.2 n=1 Tax=Cyprinus carpio TaxID=7962 RepID=A0A8C1MSW2_CYPCA
MDTGENPKFQTIGVICIYRLFYINDVIKNIKTYMSISYCGVEASDHPQFDLSQYFCSTASFIKAALTQNGKCDFLDLFLTNFVSDCIEIKRSRSALVLAFLMMCENLTITDAIIAVRLNRDICPNSGFLEHLRDLGNQLKR